MPRTHTGLPKANRTELSKRQLLAQLLTIDGEQDRRARVLALETEFRRKVSSHVASLPAQDSILEKFNTSPFVLLKYGTEREYKSKYGASTTHMNKLLPRLKAGRSGGCPVLAIGITQKQKEN